MHQLGRRIDEETIIRINEIYLKCGVKSQTARIVNVSPATVTKYLIPNYISQEDRDNTTVTFDKEIKGAENLIADILNRVTENCSAAAAFCEICKVTPEEWEEIREIQKGIII